MMQIIFVPLCVRFLFDLYFMSFHRTATTVLIVQLVIEELGTWKGSCIITHLKEICKFDFCKDTLPLVVTAVEVDKMQLMGFVSSALGCCPKPPPPAICQDFCMASGSSSSSSVFLRRSTVPGTFAALAFAFTFTFALAFGLSEGCDASASFFFSTDVSRLLRGDRNAMRPTLSRCGETYFHRF